jgi:hypothetical protein
MPGDDGAESGAFARTDVASFSFAAAGSLTATATVTAAEVYSSTVSIVPCVAAVETSSGSRPVRAFLASPAGGALPEIGSTSTGRAVAAADRPGTCPDAVLCTADPFCSASPDAGLVRTAGFAGLIAVATTARPATRSPPNMHISQGCMASTGSWFSRTGGTTRGCRHCGQRKYLPACRASVRNFLPQEHAKETIIGLPSTIPYVTYH